ncbi:hypothetical protein L917_00757, partial [Phytophthora nicotianae]
MLTTAADSLQITLVNQLPVYSKLDTAVSLRWWLLRCEVYDRKKKLPYLM